jgi:uncharacterized protein with GYD domain
MPYFLHQWRYKDQQTRAMVSEVSDRAEVVRIATEAFGGTMHMFFYCFGDYDGIAISSYPDNETAFASLMSIFGQGRLAEVHTTVLLPSEEGLGAMKRVHDLLFPHGPQPPLPRT